MSQPLEAGAQVTRIATTAFVRAVAWLADGVVTEPKLADGSMTGSKIAPGVVTKDKLSGPLQAPLFALDNGIDGMATGNGDGAD